MSGGLVSYFPTFDANGNVSEFSNPQSEITNPQSLISAHYEYSPFGETIVATGSKADDFPFRFSTKYTDDETALVYYGYRYYSPTMGRWLSRDPIEELTGLHLYAFVGNSPIGLVDEIGLQASCSSVNCGQLLQNAQVYQQSVQRLSSRMSSWCGGSQGQQPSLLNVLTAGKVLGSTAVAFGRLINASSQNTPSASLYTQYGQLLLQSFGYKGPVFPPAGLKNVGNTLAVAGTALNVAGNIQSGIQYGQGQISGSQFGQSLLPTGFIFLSGTGAGAIGSAGAGLFLYTQNKIQQSILNSQQQQIQQSACTAYQQALQNAQTMWTQTLNTYNTYCP